MDDMHDQHETPTSDAARGVGHYLTGALAAADLVVRVRTWFTSRLADERHTAGGLHPGDLEQAGTVLDPKREAYNAMLGRDEGRGADSRTALLAWISAQPQRHQNSEAELVAGRAEARLRDLHPDAMTRYDALRAGLSPVEAMREVVPLIVVEQQHGTAHEMFAPMLDPAVAANADSRQALAAWSAALPLADELPDAAQAAVAAEGRLRELHPDAMGRYDALRDTHTPTAALDEISPLIDPALPTNTTGGPAPAGVAAASASPEAVLPPEQRYAPVVREVLQAQLADQVLREKAWPALAGALAKAEQLGAHPAAVLAVAAVERELNSAKSVADVLAFRIERHHIPAQPVHVSAQPRTSTAADLVASSYPTPLAARPGSRTGPQDIVALGAELELDREAETDRQTARDAIGAVDDDSTTNVDGRRRSRDDVQPHVEPAAADQATSTAALGQADARHAPTTAGAPPTATAAHSYPTPIGEVSGPHAVPKATASASSARTRVRKAPMKGRGR